jgi:hypothetical protein
VCVHAHALLGVGGGLRMNLMETRRVSKYGMGNGCFVTHCDHRYAGYIIKEVIGVSSIPII